MACVRRAMARARPLLAAAFLVGIGAAAVVAALSTTGEERATAKATAEAGEGPLYSPFVVHVRHDDAPFDVISFKDVGMSVPPEQRQHVYESIAQSLSYELASHRNLPMSSEVRYSKSIADPDNHKHCEGRHIYVDVWHEASSPQWGYSLWSGCSEADQFAWKQLPASHADKHSYASVEPLTRHIAQSLREAVETGCFTKAC